jgi:hypothetical protein
MQQRLSLFPSAIKVLFRAIRLDLRNMPLNAFPPLDLALVIGAAPAHVVPAIPLKPPPRIFAIDPALFFPFCQWLRGVDTEEIQYRHMALVIQFGAYKPVFRELVGTVRHVFPAENTQRQHLLRRYFRTEVSVKVLAYRLSQEIVVIPLHEIIYNDSVGFFHSPVAERPR